MTIHTVPQAAPPRSPTESSANTARISGDAGGTLDWAHKPSPFHYSVMIYGGQNPATGFDQPQHEVQFHVRRYTLAGILERANRFALGEWRTHFAVRSPEGVVVYNGPVLNAIEEPKVIGLLTDAELTAHAADQRRFSRRNG